MMSNILIGILLSLAFIALWREDIVEGMKIIATMIKMVKSNKAETIEERA